MEDASILASAGAVIKVWNNFNVIKEFSSFPNSKVTSISWSPNGSYIVSCHNEGNNIAVTDVKNPDKVILFSSEEKDTFVKYSSRKNCVFLSCGQSSVISIWDIRSQSVTKKLKTLVAGSKIKCASFDSRDCFVAGGFQNGEVQVFNTMNTSSHPPIVRTNIQAINALDFGIQQKMWLGAASDDGSCNLYDCNSNKWLHCFGQHSAPATGFRFSPVNEILVASVGFDKIVNFYDSRSRKFIAKISTKEPLNCLDFTKDGQYVTVGSTRGSIFVYDLRQMNSPYKAITKAHNEAVSCVQAKKVMTKTSDDFDSETALQEFSSNSQQKSNSVNGIDEYKHETKWRVTNMAEPLALTGLNHKNVTNRTNSLSRTRTNLSIANQSEISVSANHSPKFNGNYTNLSGFGDLSPEHEPLSMCASPYARLTPKLNQSLSSNGSVSSPFDDIGTSTRSSFTDVTNSFEVDAVNIENEIYETSKSSVETILDGNLSNISLDQIRVIVREEVNEQLKELKKNINSSLSIMNINSMRQFISTETAIGECNSKLDNLDAKLSTIMNELKYWRNNF